MLLPTWQIDALTREKQGAHTMSHIPRPLSEWFRRVRPRFFFAAVRVTTEEAVDDLEAKAINTRGE